MSFHYEIPRLRFNSVPLLFLASGIVTQSGNFILPKMHHWRTATWFVQLTLLILLMPNIGMHFCPLSLVTEATFRVACIFLVLCLLYADRLTPSWRLCNFAISSIPEKNVMLTQHFCVHYQETFKQNISFLSFRFSLTTWVSLFSFPLISAFAVKCFLVTGLICVV